MRLETVADIGKGGRHGEKADADHKRGKVEHEDLLAAPIRGDVQNQVCIH